MPENRRTDIHLAGPPPLRHLRRVPIYASHVLMIEPVRFRFNPETAASNVFQFQEPPTEAEADTISLQAPEQHRRLRDLLVASGVYVTAARSRDETPDAPFCNNWFSTHFAVGSSPATLVLYPLLAPNRRLERRGDLVELFRAAYPRMVDLSGHEREARYLESTGSLCLDHANRVAYAALSPRTDRALAEEWARQLDYRLVAFTATDDHGVPYYHTNVMMFLGHAVAGVTLEAITDPAERQEVEHALTAGGFEIVAIARSQSAQFCGNCLALSNDEGTPLLVMSSAAFHGFTAGQRTVLERHATLLHTDLSAFERLAGGSARCLLAELF
jgi:hypothetical protein